MDVGEFCISRQSLFSLLGELARGRTVLSLVYHVGIGMELPTLRGRTCPATVCVDFDHMKVELKEALGIQLLHDHGTALCMPTAHGTERPS